MIRYRAHNPASQCSHNEGMFHVSPGPEAGIIDREHPRKQEFGLVSPGHVEKIGAQRIGSFRCHFIHSTRDSAERSYRNGS